eukprot:TRINITY_DN50945_c0_g1_i1.p1 TRINITY_DN50945_c0_g1~~TRINITY_DN50945_c0_g1_i1.p1  ORF type:complete len:583 (-),score=84.95 TRINITY_DN50945_c0_g1_i1:35-1702(-)
MAVCAGSPLHLSSVAVSEGGGDDAIGASPDVVQSPFAIVLGGAEATHVDGEGLSAGTTSQSGNVSVVSRDPEMLPLATVCGATSKATKRPLPSSREELVSEDPMAFDDSRRLLLRGSVLRRKVMGRSLAFCSLMPEAYAEVDGPWRAGPPQQSRVTGGGSSDSASTVGLCFTAGFLDPAGTSATEEERPWWWDDPCRTQTGPSEWAAFPERKGDLRVGTQVEVSTVFAPTHRLNELLVRRWRFLENSTSNGSASTPSQSSAPLIGDMAEHHAARNLVNQAARLELAKGRKVALCKFWSKGRSGAKGCQDGCQFRHSFVDSDEEARVAAEDVAKRRSKEIAAQDQLVYNDVDGSPHMDSKAGKSRRAARFASWLLAQYGRDALSAGSGVLDVAGGRGDLSWALSFDADVPCTLVDPALRRGGNLTSWQRRALRKSGKSGFAHVAEVFSERLFGGQSSLDDEKQQSHASLLRDASLVVGLHPDEATEAIVDLALASGRKFAVVPCCVFANKFPDRELQPGVRVTSLNQFCAYLRAKDERIQETLLDFEGRNKVLFLP